MQNTHKAVTGAMTQGRLRNPGLMAIETIVELSSFGN